MPFVYSPQPQALLVDIRSFITDFEMAMDMYFLYYSPIIFLNDLIMFCHRETGHQEHIPSLGGLEWILHRSRNCKGKAASSLVNIIKSYQENPSWRHCRMLFALLTPTERTRFINTFILQDEITVTPETEVDQWYQGDDDNITV
tara:strand:+ start:1495 stop:1926 length:432 start_codon:yes stop_codon:yes gene_type:complete